jgi:UDP-N-acetyl-D-mannosaminuronic acid dehydrogenase
MSIFQMRYNPFQNYQNRGKSLKFNKICVIGLGYIGLPTACTFAARGIEVIGVDTNPRIVEVLKNGGVHLYEPGLEELATNALASWKLRVSSQPAIADAFIIAVPTPFQDGKKADMSFVLSACESIVPFLRPGNLVVLESTSPPRTTVDLALPILEKSGLRAGKDFLLAYSPERVLPGRILEELVENARVIGGIDPASAQAGSDLYGLIVKGEIIQTDSTTAEMVKLMENTYRDVNIAIANEFSRLGERFGIDIWEAISIANHHPRVRILTPGPGVGGHCISVDPWFLVESAPDITPLIRTAREVNDSQPEFVLKKVEKLIGPLKGKTIAAFGLAYKPDVDDFRESPAVNCVRLLQNSGARVSVFEPFLKEPLPGILTAPTIEEAVREADLLLMLVNHSQFHTINPMDAFTKTTARIVLDTVNGWDRGQWEKAGFNFHKLGSGRD